MKIKLSFTITPIAKQSVKYSGRNKAFYQPEKYKKYNDAIVIMAKRQTADGFRILNGMLRINYIIYKFKIPLKRSKQIINDTINYKSGKPDLADNLNKPLFDALSNVIYKDDSQIVEIKNMRKVYAKQEGIEIEIEEIK